jgi:hypothetical protein
VLKGYALVLSSAVTVRWQDTSKLNTQIIDRFSNFQATSTALMPPMSSTATFQCPIVQKANLSVKAAKAVWEDLVDAVYSSVFVATETMTVVIGVTKKIAQKHQSAVQVMNLSVTMAPAFQIDGDAMKSKTVIRVRMKRGVLM